LGISFLYYKKQIPVYVSSAKVLLKDPQKGGGDTKVLDALNIFSEKKIVENEIIVLRSSNLMKEVVKSLDIYSKVYKEGKNHEEELYGDNLPLQFISQNKETIKNNSTLSFSIDWINKKINIDNKSIRFGGNFKIGNDFYKTVINTSYQNITNIEDYFVKFKSISSEAASVIGSLSAAPISYSSTVIDVKLESAVPEKGFAILNKLFEVYNRAGIEDKNQMAVKTLDFIEERLKTITGQLDSVEKNIQDYKTKNDLINLSDQATLYLSSVRDLDKDNGLLQIQFQLLDDFSAYLNNKNDKPGTVPSLFLLNDETLKSLLSQLYQSEFELDKIQKTSGEKSDNLILAAQKTSRIKNDIRENIVNVRRNLLIQKKNNDLSIEASKIKYASIPEKERGLLSISREQEIKNNIYSYLLQKREETAMSSASTSADLRLLESGFSSSPIRPVPKNYYWVGFIIGIVFFLLYIQLREKIKNKIMFRHDIEKRTSVPVTAELLQTKDNEVIAVRDGKRSVIAEQFRTLRTNLGFIGLNENNNTLLINSSISGEGKSFIAINLAISLTLTGKKVALLELDLRKPKLSGYLNIEITPGISNYLVNKATLDEIVKPTEFENLFLIPAGTIPPNPSELIIRNEFQELVKVLKSRFDYIIFDTAPVGPVTDAQLLSHYADISLFVVRHNYTPNHLVKEIESLHLQKKYSNMAIVFNGIKPRGTSIFNVGFGGYGNGYGNGYGYGYGYSDAYKGYYSEENSSFGLNNIWNIKKLFSRFFKSK
jgi:capsular exopolysaccharide synthesis family protein